MLCRAVLLCLLLLAPQAHASSIEWECTAPQPSCRSVFIVHSAWHAAIVLRKGDIPSEVVPELADFPSAQFVEFSWGDKDYFPNPRRRRICRAQGGILVERERSPCCRVERRLASFLCWRGNHRAAFSARRLRTFAGFCLKNFFTPGAGVSRSSLPWPFCPQLFLSRHAQVQPSKDLQRLGCRSARVSGPADRAQLCDHSGPALRTDRQA